MSYELNEIVFTGFVGSKDELRKTTTGKSVCKFSVGIPYEREGTDGKKTDWESHSIEVWNATAEWCSEKLTQGSHVLIHGQLRQSSWDDKTTGKKQYRTYIQAKKVQAIKLKE